MTTPTAAQLVTHALDWRARAEHCAILALLIEDEAEAETLRRRALIYCGLAIAAADDALEVAA